MYSSFAFRSEWPIEALSLIPLVAGLAVRSALEELAGVSVGLRWPNDLMLGGGKLGGLLVESSGGRVVIGCGVNLEWASPLEGAVALDASSAAVVDRVDLAAAWADRFLTRVDRLPDEWGVDEYRAACVTIGRPVAYAGGSGEAVGIADDGSLLVDSGSGIVSIHSGEVRLHDTATLPGDRRD